MGGYEHEEVARRIAAILEVQERIEAWLSAGAKSVWLVDPDRRRVMVYAHPHRSHVFEAAETLSDPAIPSFSLQVAEVFPER